MSRALALHLLISILFFSQLAPAQGMIAEKSRPSTLDQSSLDTALRLELSTFDLTLIENDPSPQDPIYQRQITSVGSFGQTQTNTPKPASGSTRARYPNIHLTISVLNAKPAPEIQISIALDDPSQSHPFLRTRTIKSHDIPAQTLTRTLALSATELLRASLFEFREMHLEKKRRDLQLRQSELEKRFRQQQATPSLVYAPSDRTGVVQISLSPTLSAASSIDTPLFGGEIGVSFQHFNFWRWSLEVGYFYGRKPTPLGKLGVKRLSGSLGGDLHLPAAPAFRFGPRVQVHALSGQGETNSDAINEEAKSGYALSATFRSSFEVAFGSSLLLRTTLEAGPIVRSMSFTAGGYDSYRFHGLLTQWGIGGAFRL